MSRLLFLLSVSAEEALPMIADGSVWGGGGVEPSPTKRPRALHKYAGIHKKSLNVLMIVENNQLYVFVLIARNPLGITVAL
jgi:hypothetical protein